MGTASIRAIVVAALGSLGIACGAGDLPALDRLEDPGAAFSAVRYPERDLVSLNDRCPVSGTRLDAAIAPVYVNGRPIGFC
jgi:hypothetical protein